MGAFSRTKNSSDGTKDAFLTMHSRAVSTADQRFHTQRLAFPKPASQKHPFIAAFADEIREPSLENKLSFQWKRNPSSTLSANSNQLYPANRRFLSHSATLFRPKSMPDLDAAATLDEATEPPAWWK